MLRRLFQHSKFRPALRILEISLNTDSQPQDCKVEVSSSVVFAPSPSLGDSEKAGRCFQRNSARKFPNHLC